jgi:hypothetical protein
MSASRNDFELDDPYQQLATKTLEEVIMNGESEAEKKISPEHISINKMPQWVNSVMINLKKENHGLNVATVERLTCKLGIACVREQFGEPIGEVAHLRSRIYKLTDQMLLQKSYHGSSYELQETVGFVYRKCSLREWTAGAISDQLVDPLNLSNSCAVLLVLISGISKSETVVPRGWVNLANKELEYFHRYLENETHRLRTDILGNK